MAGRLFEGHLMQKRLQLKELIYWDIVDEMKSQRRDRIVFVMLGWGSGKGEKTDFSFSFSWAQRRVRNFCTVVTSNIWAFGDVSLFWFGFSSRTQISRIEFWVGPRFLILSNSWIAGDIFETTMYYKIYFELKARFVSQGNKQWFSVLSNVFEHDRVVSSRQKALTVF